MQGTGYPCDEEAESSVRKTEVMEKPALPEATTGLDGQRGKGPHH